MPAQTSSPSFSLISPTKSKTPSTISSRVHVDLHFAYLEINPLVRLDTTPNLLPTIHFLDMAAKLDQTANSIKVYSPETHITETVPLALGVAKCAPQTKASIVQSVVHTAPRSPKGPVQEVTSPGRGALRPDGRRTQANNQIVHFDSKSKPPNRPAYRPFNATILSEDEELLDRAEDPWATRGILVFHPTLDESSDFEAYMERIEVWGRRSGVVKVIPLEEWSTYRRIRTDGLSSTTPRLSSIKLKHPIEKCMAALCAKDGLRAPPPREADQAELNAWRSRRAREGEDMAEDEVERAVLAELVQDAAGARLNRLLPGTSAVDYMPTMCRAPHPKLDSCMVS
ncbi:hypothetical protein FRC10_011503 [Ceratobasidium sp. 414]|nr:hypothetical protein FRC10_011503 [Ceratobasidium sp. 414]